jgi:ribosome biogenesis GTPase
LCQPGQTFVFLGATRVGKFTLTIALAGTDAIATQALREDDAMGCQATTWRELQLTDAATDIADVCEDIGAMSVRCRSDDCQHRTAPG